MTKTVIFSVVQLVQKKEIAYMTIEKDGKTFAVAESLYSWAVCRLFGGTPLRCKVSKRQCPNYCDLQSFVLTSPIF